MREERMPGSEASPETTAWAWSWKGREGFGRMEEDLRRIERVNWFGLRLRDERLLKRLRA